MLYIVRVKVKVKVFLREDCAVSVAQSYIKLPIRQWVVQDSVPFRPEQLV